MPFATHRLCLPESRPWDCFEASGVPLHRAKLSALSIAIPAGVELSIRIECSALLFLEALAVPETLWDSPQRVFVASWRGIKVPLFSTALGARADTMMSGEAWLYLLSVLINAVNLFLQVFFTIMYSDLEW